MEYTIGHLDWRYSEYSSSINAKGTGAVAIMALELIMHFSDVPWMIDVLARGLHDGQRC